MDDLRQLVYRRTLERPGLEVQPFVDHILRRYGRRVVGVFLYGSVLSQVTASTTSFPDFFVVTDGYRRIFRRLSHWLLAYPLPPHIYHLRLDDQRRCKYNLVSYRRFRRECSGRAKDIYILGRFGKRVALVYARDKRARDNLLACCYDAMDNVVPWTLRGMSGSFSEAEFTLACLNISYAGETRVEASSKVPKLFEAEKPFYLEVYPGLLHRQAAAHRLVSRGEDGRLRPVGSSLQRWLRQLRFRWFLKRSRIRGILRWPKFLVTVEDWVDIILAKIERTKGIKIKLKPKEKRHPLIYGWSYFFRLLRAGAIGSSKKPPNKGSVE